MNKENTDPIDIKKKIGKFTRHVDRHMKDGEDNYVQHNKTRALRSKKRSRYIKIDKECIIRNHPDYWDLINKNDEATAKEKGRDFMNTSLGFCILVYLFIHRTRHDKMSFSRDTPYCFAENLLDKQNIKEKEPVTLENAEMLINLVEENYMNHGHRRKIEREEYRDFYYMCLNFLDDMDIDLIDEVDISKERIVRYLKNNFRDFVVLFDFLGKPKVDRAYDTPEEDYFYFRLLAGCFPDYYAVFREMGFPERKLRKAIDDPKFGRIFKAVEDQYTLKVEAKRWEEANSGNSAAQNAVLKSLSDTNPVDRIRKQSRERKDREKHENSFLDGRIGNESLDESNEIELEESDDKITHD